MHFSFRVALLLLLLPWEAFCYFGKANSGQAVFAWTANLQTPRSIALEGAAGALPSADAGAIQLNPSALRSDSAWQAGAYWQTGDLDANQGLLTFSHPLYKWRLQHTYGFVDNGEVKGTDEYGDYTGQSHYPLAQMYMATATLPLTHFRFGASLRMLWEQLSYSEGNQAALGTALDWGLQWNFPSSRYGLGFAARNFGAQWRAFTENGSTGHPLSSELAIHGFLRPASLPRLALLGEADAPRYAPVALKLGGEYTLGKSLVVRAGMQRNAIDLVRQARSLFGSTHTPDETGTHRLFSVGAGYQARWLTLDYSYSHLFEGMGSEHRCGLRADF